MGLDSEKEQEESRLDVLPLTNDKRIGKLHLEDP